MSSIIKHFIPESSPLDLFHYLIVFPLEFSLVKQSYKHFKKIILMNLFYICPLFRFVLYFFPRKYGNTDNVLLYKKQKNCPAIQKPKKPKTKNMKLLQSDKNTTSEQSAGEKKSHYNLRHNRISKTF